MKAPMPFQGLTWCSARFHGNEANCTIAAPINAVILVMVNVHPSEDCLGKLEIITDLVKRVILFFFLISSTRVHPTPNSKNTSRYHSPPP